MWWFTPREERTMARRFKVRRAFAQRLARDANTARLAQNNKTVAAEGLRLSQEDEAAFERLFGEPMPAQLCTALHLETDVWIDIKNKLTGDHRALQRRLVIIEKVLALEREMLHTPLVRRYQQALGRLQRDR
jgi:glycine/D-amino acid oxidase-like deaminating enzyme